jgi:hypothetical protein
LLRRDTDFAARLRQGYGEVSPKFARLVERAKAEIDEALDRARPAPGRVAAVPVGAGREPQDSLMRAVRVIG